MGGLCVVGAQLRGLMAALGGERDIKVAQSSHCVRVCCVFLNLICQVACGEEEQVQQVGCYLLTTLRDFKRVEHRERCVHMHHMQIYPGAV